MPPHWDWRTPHWGNAGKPAPSATRGTGYQCHHGARAGAHHGHQHWPHPNAATRQCHGPVCFPQVGTATSTLRIEEHPQRCPRQSSPSSSSQATSIIDVTDSSSDQYESNPPHSVNWVTEVGVAHRVSSVTGLGTTKRHHESSPPHPVHWVTEVGVAHRVASVTGLRTTKRHHESTPPHPVNWVTEDGVAHRVSSVTGPGTATHRHASTPPHPGTPGSQKPGSPHPAC